MDDTGEKASLGGLWPSVRKGGKCAYCRSKQAEWDEAMKWQERN